MGHLTACHEEHTRNKKALEGLTVCRLPFYQLTCYLYIISQGLMKFIEIQFTPDCLQLYL